MDSVPPDRGVSLDGVFNFRDLGGWPAADGRTVRWRQVFRADSLGMLTLDDVELLRPLGLRTVLDLRTAGEVDMRGRFPSDAYAVDYHHVPVVDRSWSPEEAQRVPPTQFLHGAYREMLVEGAPQYAAALTLLSGDGALPAVFHCAAGKDRTGLLAALLLGAIGVTRESIVEDYALTQAAMDRFASRIEPDVPAVFLLADPDAMTLLLDDLTREHGSIRRYVQSIGVADDVLDRLCNRLLVTPEDS